MSRSLDQHFREDNIASIQSRPIRSGRNQGGIAFALESYQSRENNLGRVNELVKILIPRGAISSARIINGRPRQKQQLSYVGCS